MNKILLLLKNKLLKEALYHYLSSKINNSFKIELAPETSTNSQYSIILFDPPSLKETNPNDFSPAAKILIDTGLSEQELIFLALYYKLAGIFEKDSSPELLLKCFEKVLKGEIWLSKKITKKLFFEYSFISQNKLPNISPRELEIINLVIEGCNNNEIAKKLYLSNYTVKCHLNRIYKKLGISSRTQLIKFFYKNNHHISPFGPSSERRKIEDKIEANQTELTPKPKHKIIKIKSSK